MLPKSRSLHRALALGSLVCAVLALGGAPAVRAQGDAPSSAVGWSQFQGNAAHSGALPETETVAEPPYAQAWTFSEPDSDQGLSTPAIVGSIAVAVGAEAVYGIDLETGEQAWRVERDGGPIAEPALAESGTSTLILYTEGDDAESSKLVAIDAAKQEPVWEADLGAISGSGVTVDGETALVGDDNGTLHAIDVAEGTQSWTSEGAGRVEAPPAAADGIVFASSRELSQGNARIRALDEQTGETRWQFSQEGLASGSAITVSEGRAIGGFTDRLARAFDADSGTGDWASLVSSALSPRSSPAALPGAVYLADLSGTIVRIDAATGERLWDYRFNASRPISIPYLVYASSPVVTRSAVLIGLGDGRLAAVSTRSGRLVWEFDTGPGALGGIALGTATQAGLDVVVVAKRGADGGLVAFRHDDTAMLLDEPSPTELDPAELFGNYAIAFLIVFVLIAVPFWVLRRRGPRPAPPGPIRESA